MEKKICHITTVHQANDDRVFYKECVSLNDNGYKVYLLVQNSKNEVKDGVNIVALPFFNSRLQRLFYGGWRALVQSLKIKADIYHFHDPELMIVGVLLKMFGKRVIYDVHEDLSKQVLYKNWITSKFVRKILSKIIRVLELLCTRFYDCVVVVTDDISNNFSNSKTIIVKNYPVVSLINESSNNEIDIHTSNRVLVYAGGLSKVRGIKEIVQALSFLPENVELWLLGAWQCEVYCSECEELPSWNKVRYLGQKDLKDVYPYIKAADIGLAMLYPAKNYLTSLPVKAFEYMALSKPFIMSDFPYWQSMFKTCADFCNPMNPRQIAEKIELLLNNNELAIKKGSEGKKIIMSKYSWENEYEKMSLVYDNLLVK